ncbi:hypothetical protein Tco_0976257 [Tanacetum coccineum]|uniref:Uncharacterized protein n=1 Tax=Tanacetum coccineum TaxID=301880 RepID=A0ABQ5EGQ6_9ASTR
MHNNIMAAGSKDRPPMLGPGRYSQWHSRFLRYIDTKANGEYLRKCIFDGPYKLTSVVIKAVAATVSSSRSDKNMTKLGQLHEHVLKENKLNFKLKRKLFLTSNWNNLQVTTNARECSISSTAFHPEWSRFVTLGQAIRKNKNTSHIIILFDILKQFQRVRYWYYQALKPQRTNATSSSTKTKVHLPDTRRQRGPPHPINTSILVLSLKKNSDPEQAQRDKEMQKNLENHTPCKTITRKLYKTYQQQTFEHSSRLRNKTEDTTQGITSDNQSRQFGNQKDNDILLRLKGNSSRSSVPLQAEQADWQGGHGRRIDEQELEAHYNYNGKDSGGLTLEETSSTSQSIGTGVQNHDEVMCMTSVRHIRDNQSINYTYKTFMVEGYSNATPDSSNIVIMIIWMTKMLQNVG